MSITDRMTCRACGREERASEGYPCQRCGTFVCVMCNIKGVVLCTKCQAEAPPAAAPPPAAPPST